MTPDMQQKIRQLLQQGASPGRIARAHDIPLAEVQKLKQQPQMKAADAVAKFLAAAKQPKHINEIVAGITAKGWWQTTAKRPDAVVRGSMKADRRFAFNAKTFLWSLNAPTAVAAQKEGVAAQLNRMQKKCKDAMQENSGLRPEISVNGTVIEAKGIDFPAIEFGDDPFWNGKEDNIRQAVASCNREIQQYYDTRTNKKTATDSVQEKPKKTTIAKITGDIIRKPRKTDKIKPSQKPRKFESTAAKSENFIAELQELVCVADEYQTDLRKVVMLRISGENTDSIRRILNIMA